MGLLDRLNLLVRSELNALRGQRDAPDSPRADRDDAPGHDRRRQPSVTLAEIESTLREARVRLKQVLQDERRLERELEGCRKRESDLEERAMQALRAGDERGAREALADRNTAARLTRKVRLELEEHRTYVADLMRGLEALERKLDAHTLRDAPPPAAASVATDDMRRWEALFERRRAASSATRDRLDADLDRAADERSFSFDAPRAPSHAAPPADPGERFTLASDRIDASLARFDELEDKLDVIEARAAAANALDTSPLTFDEDDPLFDPKLADLERRFRELERKQRGSR